VTGSSPQRTWAVVPVKSLAEAKTRLSPVLSPAERRQLFTLMLTDVLTALTAAGGLAGVLVVTGDEEAARLAEGHGARILREDTGRGQSAAIAAAAQAVGKAGEAALLAIPADVPLATATEIEAMLATHGTTPAVTLAPAADRRGTNGLLASPPDVIPFRFGDDSFAPHCEEARRCGIEPAVLTLPGIGLDIDRPDDLRALIARPMASRAQAWLHESGIARRLEMP
jgi:2-phospho-L-lactate guanylyltransferase